MINTIEINKTIYVIGDIHGSFETFIDVLRKKEISNATIIVAGDCGFGFSKKTYYDQILDYLDKKYCIPCNVNVLFIRGNHDDPDYFNNSSGGYCLGNFKCIPDYTVLKYNDKHVLCVGGALSIDRLHRMTHDKSQNKYAKHSKKYTYWENELPVYNEELIREINNSYNITHIITHASPRGVYPLTKGGVTDYAEYDHLLMRDENYVRETLYNIGKSFNNVSKWYFGHYHKSNRELIDNCVYIALNTLTYEFYHIDIIELI